MGRLRKIKVHKRYIHDPSGKLVLGGWLSGEQTYLWLGAEGENGKCLGYVQGKGLLRLARNIVREFESAKGGAK